MDNSKAISNPNPRERANPFSVWSFWWTIRIFKRGKKILGPEDLYEPIKTDRSDTLGDQLEMQWNAEVQNAKREKRSSSLLKTIFRTFFYEYFILGCIQILNEFVLRLGTPILLGGLLQYFKSEPTTTYETALLCAIGISVANALNAITVNQALFEAYHLGGRVRVAMCSLVYRKALRLSKTALGETAPGKVVNLVASDVNRFDYVSILIHHMWSAPLSAVIIALILYYKAGYAGAIGIIPVFIVMPIQAYTGKLSSKYRLQTALKTDERVRFMNEIISGVQVIKMYAWEKPFCALIELARRLELKVVKKSSYIRGIYMTFGLFTTRVALYCTILAMLLLTGEKLTAERVFVFSSYFNILAQTMSGLFVRGVAEIAECRVAVKRLQTFLLLDEFERYNDDFSVTGPNGTIGSEQNPNGRKGLSVVGPGLSFGDKKLQGLEFSNKLYGINHEDDVVQLVKYQAQNKPRRTENEKWTVKLDEVTAKWDLCSTETTMEDISLELEKGKLYIVIGMVGSGKSSLLSTILGEVNIVRGTVKVNGKISYADQECWVFGASVRQNILFGQPFDKKRYQRVIKVCSLQKDFDQFPKGDQTIVGEKGGSLSGGQRARVNLARAVYREADIYLLDDPLSAVDAHVGKHLFQECLQSHLGGKTRLLATHQLQYLKEADSIILLEQGKMRQYRNYHDLLNVHPEYSVLIAKDETDDTTPMVSDHPLKRQFSSSSNKSNITSASGSDYGADLEGHDLEELADNMEETSRGSVKGSLMLNYIKSGANYLVIFLIVFLFILTQFCTSLNDYFIPVLIAAQFGTSNSSSLHLVSNGTNSENSQTSLKVLEDEGVLSRDFYLYVYTGIVVSIFVAAMVRSFLFYTIAMRCSQRLHDLMFGALIRASMRFFDTNPSGTILNRFSKDLGAIDELLPKAILDASQQILVLIGSLVVTSLVNPIFLVPIGLISCLFHWIRKNYLTTSKNIKRLEGMTRSPVFTHLNATLNGLSTIRAYRAQEILKREFDKFQDVHTASWYMFIATSMAFGFSLDMCLSIFTTVVAFSFIIFKESFTAGQVGLAVTQVMAMTGIVQWGMRQSAEVTNQLMSVERVLQYTQIPPEKNLRKSTSLAKKKRNDTEKEQRDDLIEPPQNWPSAGRIDLRSVSMRYADDYPPVLKDLTLSILPSEKIGIVGRTGAGKSSLISALFRLAKVEGVIEIDGIDTDTIALEDLRRSISIIPQDPVLFSGTLRRNLDPFNEFSDEYLWSVLDEVELKDAVTATSNGLDHRVMDRGANYSVGQRQLICLARAILRNNRILMLDEATANVDPHTDSLIQRTIRTKFSSCTVLTIAHRLNTIMDSDKVIVMDKGHVVEYDHPHILLQDHHGQFSSLVKETGHAMYEQLCEVAREAYTAKHKDTQFE